MTATRRWHSVLLRTVADNRTANLDSEWGLTVPIPLTSGFPKQNGQWCRKLLQVTIFFLWYGHIDVLRCIPHTGIGTVEPYSKTFGAKRCVRYNRLDIAMKWLNAETMQYLQDCLLKKEAECTLAALQLLIAWGERRACVLVKFSNIIMKEICSLTVRCRYYAVKIKITTIHTRHHIARPRGWGVFCGSTIWTAYVITALDCTSNF